MELRKVGVSLVYVSLLCIVGMLSGCGEESEENATQGKETVLDAPAPVYDVDEESIEAIQPSSDINLDEQLNSVELGVDQLTESVFNEAAEVEEKSTEAANEMISFMEESVADSQDEMREMHEDITGMLEETAVEPVAEVYEGAEDIVVVSPDLIRRVQQALARAGYNPGPVDGVSGPRTVAAIKQFQQDNNLASGELTRETLRTLGVEF